MAQHRADARAHDGRMHGPHQEFVGPRGDAGDLVVGALNAGEDQHGDEAGAVLALDLAAEVQAADLGQHQIQDDQVHLLAAQQVESFRGPRRLQDAAALGLQGGPQQAEVDILSFQNQNGGGLYGFLERPLDEELPRPRRAGLQEFLIPGVECLIR